MQALENLNHDPTEERRAPRNPSSSRKFLLNNNPILEESNIDDNSDVSKNSSPKSKRKLEKTNLSQQDLLNSSNNLADQRFNKLMDLAQENSIQADLGELERAPTLTRKKKKKKKKLAT